MTALDAVAASSDLGTSLARLELNLRAALALRDSPPLRTAVLGENATLLLALPLNSGWGRLTADGLILCRERPADMGEAPERPFAGLFEDPSLTSPIAARRTVKAASGSARRLVASLLGDDRRSFKDLAAWAPWSKYRRTPSARSSWSSWTP
jgi:hypothetical protein